MKRSWLPRSAKPMKRSPMKRAGKKTKAWEKARAELKIEHEGMGITTCELRYEGCAYDDFLGFAHAAKRRKLTKEDLRHAIICCNFCHDQIEFLPPEQMKRIVDETIRSRTSLAPNSM